MHQQREGQRLTGRMPRGLEDAVTDSGQAAVFRPSLDLRLDGPRVVFADHPGEGSAHGLGPLDLDRVDVERDDVCAQRSRDLDAEEAHASDADEDRHVSRAEPRVQDRLIRGRDGVGDHGQIGQTKAAGLERRRVYRAQPAGGDDDMAREATVVVVAWEQLLRADGAAPRLAHRAVAARNDGGHHDVSADPLAGALTCVDDRAADLVAQGERQRMARGHAVVEEAEVRMAHAAARHAHQDRAGGQGGRVEVARRAGEGGARRGHLPAVQGHTHLGRLGSWGLANPAIRYLNAYLNTAISSSLKGASP